MKDLEPWRQTMISKIQSNGHSQAFEPIVITGGNGDDKIRVLPNEMGGVDVTVMNSSGQSRTYNLTAEEADRLVIQGGNGNDKIKVDPGVTQQIRILGGKGNDVIKCDDDDFVRGGKGHDWISDRYKSNPTDAGTNDTSSDPPVTWDLKSNQPV
jgi:Ca2+-binding RTX toxin-like protein